MTLTRLTTLTRMTRYLGWVVRQVLPIANPTYTGQTVNRLAVNGGPLG